MALWRRHQGLRYAIALENHVLRIDGVDLPIKIGTNMGLLTELDLMNEEERLKAELTIINKEYPLAEDLDREFVSLLGQLLYLRKPIDNKPISKIDVPKTKPSPFGEVKKKRRYRKIDVTK